MIAGVDYSTRAIDVVLLDEDTDAATWHRAPLVGIDAFDRARVVRAMWFMYFGSGLLDDTLAVGIEDPRGYGAGALYRIQGAILGCLPRDTLVHPLIPSSWRKTVGLSGNCTKDAVREFVIPRVGPPYGFGGGTEPAILGFGIAPVPERSWEWTGVDYWPQDACDAYCIALATRTLLQRTEAA